MAATTLTLRNTKGSPLTNTEMDTNISLLNSYSKGYLSKSITTSVSLTDAEADNYFFAISGTLSADATITIPSILVKSWTVHNGTTGGFNVTFKYATGAGITIQNGTRSTFYFDGTNMQSISYSNTVRISDTGTVTSTMIADGTIVNGDISASAAIAYSKLNLGTSIVNADISASAAIAYSKLNLGTSIVNADISASAAIAITKLAASTISGISLGNNLNALTISTGLSGTSYNGSGAVTIAIDSTVALRADVHYIGTTSIALNRASANLALTGISSVTLPGSTSGTVQLVPTAAVGTGTVLTIPATTGTIVTTGDTGSVTNTMLAGSIANAKLASSTISGISLGSNLNALTISTGLSGTSYNGSGAVTIAIDSTVALRADVHYIGTTSIALNRASANLALTGISSVTLPGSTSGTVQLVPTAAVGTGTILTIPAVTGTIVTTGDTGSVTNTMLAGSIANAKLASSTISGISLGSNLNTLTIGTGLSGTSYNGSTGVTIAIDSTVATLTGIQTLTNKTLTSPAVTTSLTTGSTSFDLLNTTATTINIGGASTAISIGNTAHTGTTSIQHNLYVYGNITFGGGSTQLSATQLVIDDPLIYIGDNNTADIIDLGIIGAYNNGTHLHTGLVRDASDSIWKLFSGMTSEPSSSTVDFTGVTYAPLQVGSLTSTIATGTSPLTVTSTTLVSNLNSDYLDGQHGSYYTTAGNLTGTISSTVLGNSTHYIGTTAVTLNRASANLALTGISSVTLPGSTSGTVQLVPTAAVGTGTVLTIPAVTGTIVTTGDTSTVTNTMLAGSIAITKLDSSTISGISLGSNLNALTISAPLVGTSYNGSGAVTLSIPAATSTVNGYMTSTYASKLDGIAAGATANTGTVTGVTATAPVVSSGGTAPVISMAAATTSVSGYLTSTDWTTFNNKQATLAAATTSVSGYLTSTDWTTFNGKQAALGTTANLQVNSIGVGTAASGTAGDIRATGNITAYYTVSDIRLKENINTLTNILDRVDLIGTYTFNYKTRPNKPMIGVIAQELKEQFPEIVYETTPIDKGTGLDKIYAVNYELLSTIAIGAIKEQQTIIKDLIARIEALENK